MALVPSTQITWRQHAVAAALRVSDQAIGYLEAAVKKLHYQQPPAVAIMTKLGADHQAYDARLLTRRVSRVPEGYEIITTTRLKPCELSSQAVRFSPSGDDRSYIIECTGNFVLIPRHKQRLSALDPVAHVQEMFDDLLKVNFGYYQVEELIEQLDRDSAPGVAATQLANDLGLALHISLWSLRIYMTRLTVAMAVHNNGHVLELPAATWYRNEVDD